MYGNNRTFNGNVYQRQPYNVVTDLPSMEQDSRLHAALRYFGVTLPMLVSYVLSNWPLYCGQKDDVVYENVVADITHGASIFTPPPGVRPTHLAAGSPFQTGDEVFFQNLEVVMDGIYRLIDHFYSPLQGVMDPTDEADATHLTCRACQPEMVVIFVQPEYEIPHEY